MPSSIVVASTERLDVEGAVAEVAAGLTAGCLAQIIVFFSPGVDAQRLVQALASRFAGVPVCGCSTAGGITPFGFTEAGMIVVAFPKAHFRVAAGLIEAIGTIELEKTFQRGLELRARLLTEEVPATMEGRFGLMLIDGVSNCEEQVVAGIRAAAHDFSILGGSAGDGLAFRRTTLIFEDQVVDDAAIVLLFATDLPFRTFRTQNFKLTETKLVVTAADVERRIVHELNAEPAASEYAAAIGASPNDLNPMRFALHPVAFRAGTDYYCRSIRNVNADGSLTFYCAIEEGVVLRVAEPIDLVESTRGALEAVRRDLGEVDLILGFECILRRLDAESRQALRVLEKLYLDYKVIGFHTYGEQFDAMHLNQTLTGLAIGTRRPPHDAP